MAITKKKKEPMKKKEIEEIIPNGCIISKSIYEKKSGIKWLFRDEAINEMDSGWRVFGDSKDKNMMIIDIDSLIQIEPIFKNVKDYPIGTELEFNIDAAGHYFVDTKTKERLWF